MDKPFDPDSPRYLEKNEGARDIRFNDWRRLINAAIHVRFRRKMDHRVTASHGGFDCAGIADVSLSEPVSAILRNTSQVSQICSIGKLVVIDHRVVFIKLY